MFSVISVAFTIVFGYVALSAHQMATFRAVDAFTVLYLEISERWSDILGRVGLSCVETARGNLQISRGCQSHAPRPVGQRPFLAIVDPFVFLSHQPISVEIPSLLNSRDGM